MQISIGIGLSIAAVGTVFGFANSAYGLYSGQFDFAQARTQFLRYTLLSGLAGAGAALFALQFALASPEALLTFLGVEAAGVGIGSQQSDGLEKLFHGFVQMFVDPERVLRDNAEHIRQAANAEEVPAQLVGAIMLAELWDYDYQDMGGDHIVLWGAEEHSIGIAQLRLDNVRIWNLNLPE